MKTLHYDFKNDKSLVGIAGPTLVLTRASDASYLDSDGAFAIAASGAARHTHDKDGVSLGLMHEEARTNLAKRSAEFDDAEYTATRASISATNALAPDDTLTADVLKEDATAGNSHFIAQNTVTVVNTSVYVFSVFVKKSNRNWIRLAIGNNGGTTAGNFDVDAGVTGVETNILSSGMKEYKNGFWRCWIVYTAASTSNNLQMLIAEADDDTNFNGLDQDSLILWGCDLQLGAHITSHIPTLASTVTRNAEHFEGAAWTGYGADGSTLYLEHAAIGANNSGTHQPIQLSDDSNSDTLNFTARNTTGLQTTSAATAGAAGAIDKTPNGRLLDVFVKSVVGLELDNMEHYWQGTRVQTGDQSVGVPIGIDTVYINARGDGAGSRGNSIVAEVRYYDERLTDEELEDMSNGIFPGGGKKCCLSISRRLLDGPPTKAVFPKPRQTLRNFFQ